MGDAIVVGVMGAGGVDRPASGRRRAEAVVTTSIIRPLGIAEIGRAVGDCDRGHARPVHQVGRGLHDHDLAGALSLPTSFSFGFEGF